MFNTSDDIYIQSLPKEEQTIIQEFIEQVDPNGKRSKNVLLRFLYIAKLNKVRAQELLCIFDELWNKVDKEASDEEVLRELKTGKYLKGGIDDKGRAVMQCVAALHIPSEFENAVMIKTIFLVMDMVLSDIETVKGGLVWLAWMKETGWKNFSLSLQREFANLFMVFGDAALDMFGELNIIDSPWWYSFALTLCKPFLAPLILEKLLIQTNEDIDNIFGESAKPTEDLYEKFKAGNLHRWV